MNLSQLAKAVTGTLSGHDAHFTGVSTDTRTLSAGELFVALRGPTFNGHEFVAQAADQGAVGALVSQPLATDLTTVTVADTRLALGRLAAYWRGRFELPVVAVTGSNGKTTVKEMIAAILGVGEPGLVTAGNLNNEIGVPLTLCRLRSDHRHAVIEMGMNHAGEIDYLTRLARPTVAVITNAAAAHLAGLGSVAAVARAKAEIFSGLSDHGVAVINADDPQAPLWRQLAGAHRVLEFGLHKPAAVSARYTATAEGSHLRLRTPVREFDATLPLPGEHNVYNALAATAAALALNTAPAAIREGLASIRPVPGRLVLRRAPGGTRIFDDSYNANPASLQAALAVLAMEPGRKVLVLGDMAELGEASQQLHHEMGEAARAAGVDDLLTVGSLSAATGAAFGPGARHFASNSALLEVLLADLRPDMSILVKGSRRMHMEDVVAALCAAEAIH